MRFWASMSTIGIDELAAEIGKETLASFTIYFDYVGIAERRIEWPLNILPENSNTIIRVEALGRAMVMLRSNVSKELVNHRPRFTCFGPMPLGLYKYRDMERLDEEVTKHQGEEFTILGSLGVSGVFGDLNSRTKDKRKLYRVIFHGFESLQLMQSRPNFGTWQPVFDYWKLGSDRDVIAASVLLADVEILSLEPIFPRPSEAGPNEVST